MGPLPSMSTERMDWSLGMRLAICAGCLLAINGLAQSAKRLNMFGFSLDRIGKPNDGSAQIAGKDKG